MTSTHNQVHSIEKYDGTQSQEFTISYLIPGPRDLWFLPLGGTGEIGMNLNLFGHAGQWLMVDCGVTFQEPLNEHNPTRFDVVSADPKFIVEHREHLAGIVVTHAHEDHVGAIPYLWQRFQAPIYTTPFTAEVLRRKLRQFNLLDKVTIIEVKTGDTQHIGVFEVQWLATTHSIPEPHGLVIKTRAGSIFHTADWKIDTDPVLGKSFQSRPFQRMAEQNITAMVCDSTNALRPGYSTSESAVYPELKKLISETQHRVVVSCFSSNVARLITLGRIAKETGRYFAPIGRSLQNMVSIARATGYWPDDIPIADQQHLGYLPPAEVLAVATGSQGEPRAALRRFANDGFRDLQLEKGDRVIFSSMIIPGNETAIEALVRALKARGFDVIQAHETERPIHASGHPCQEELKLIYDWVKPKIAIPTHGEPEHLDYHQKLARDRGVEFSFSGRNGDLYVIAPEPRLHKSVVTTGRIPLQYSQD